MSQSRFEYASTAARAVASVCILLFAVSAARAVHVTNVTVAPRDARTASVTFDVAWTGSWRHEVNHDAAWVFFKVRTEGDTEWQHVRLVADKVLNPTGYSQTSGTPLDLIVPRGRDGFTGMFLRRAELGQGSVRVTKVTAVWDFTANKNITRDVKVDVRAFGIYMVYVPEGPFNLGSGGTEINSFFKYTDGVHSDTPYRVTGPGAIPTGRQKGRLWSGKGAAPEDGGEIPAAFPNGYSAFYCMRYDVLAGEYAGFLDTVNADQALARYVEKAHITRSGKPPNYVYSSDSPYRSCGGLSWADGATFAAWAALRPVTELEYEKASRGPIKPGWETGHSLQYNSYWGIALMNGWKTNCVFPVTVGNTAGRRFKGTHGRGAPELPADWPQEDAVGTGTRGGFIYRNPSNRAAATIPSPERTRNQRWRGVRTAPKGVGP